MGRVLEIEVDAERLADLLDHLTGRRGEFDRPAVPSDTAHRGGDLGHGVVRGDGGPVTGRALGHEPHPRDALLGGLDEIQASLVRQGEREAPDLAHTLGDPLEKVRPVIDDPVRAMGTARLLVRKEEQDQVALRADTGATPRARERDEHRVHVLHVDRTATPHHVVDDLEVTVKE